MVLGRGSRLFGRLRSFCDPVLSGWNISTRLSIPDKDGGGTTPVSPAVIRTDRSDVSGGEGFPWTMGQRRNRDTVYYFEIALGARDITSSTFRTYSSLPPTCHRDIENVSGGQMAEPRSSIISDSLLEILNSTPRIEPRVFRESWLGS